MVECEVIVKVREVGDPREKCVVNPTKKKTYEE